MRTRSIVWIAALTSACACSKSSDESGGPGRQLADSKVEVARTMARQLAREAYPQWSMRQSNTGACPTVEELGEFVNRRDLRDPWGRPYVIQCAPDLPPGAVGIAVSSAGEDGRAGTSDDVRSWD